MCLFGALILNIAMYIMHPEGGFLTVDNKRTYYLAIFFGVIIGFLVTLFG